MEITISKRNKQHLLRDGFRFRNARVLKDGDVSWRCNVRTCPARIRIHNPDVIVLSTDHNHEPPNASGEQQTTSDASSTGKRKRRRGQKKHRSRTEGSIKDNQKKLLLMQTLVN